MIKPLIFAVSMTAGSAALGATLYMQENPRAFTTPYLSDTPTEVAAPLRTSPPVAAWVKDVPAEPARAHKRPARRAYGRPVLRTAIAIRPCSEWRDLGPASMNTGNNAIHWVRQLCP
jgi:hypothetical protein